MAESTIDFSSEKYSNLCECGPKNGISIVQPSCQVLPDGSVVNNPSYEPKLNTSFWSYKFLTDCGENTKPLKKFGILICEIIPSELIIVSEKIDGCGSFNSVPFTLTKEDPDFGVAPEKFQYLIVDSGDRYDNGVCVEYRLEIIGNFPTAIQPIKVLADNDVINFDCEGCFIVPECNPQGKLTIIKNSEISIVNNTATIMYSIDIGNIGNAILENVKFEDIIIMPTQLTIGAIKVDPSFINVDTSIPGQIIITGTIDEIKQGETLKITYEIPIINVIVPGKYIINNTASVTAEGTYATASSSATLDVVKLTATSCCSIEGDKGTFRQTISSIDSSPDTVVNIYGHMEVPTGITIKFDELSGCEWYYSGTTDPVPINTDISGPVSFDIACSNLSIPTGSSYSKEFSYILVSSTIVGNTGISNTITKIEPVNPDKQILIGTSNVPVTSEVNVQLTQISENPCSSLN